LTTRRGRCRIHVIVGASQEEGSHRYSFQGRVTLEQGRCPDCARASYDRRSGIRLGGAVLERSRRMGCDGPVFFVSSKGGAGFTEASSSASVIPGLLNLPAGGVLSSLYLCLQNALRRLFLSMTRYSNPHLPLVSQLVAAQVPRGPPHRHCDIVTCAFWSRASVRKALSSRK
jgi:hypothetical protein